MISVRFKVDLQGRNTWPIALGSKAERLYTKYKISKSDEDWDEFVDFMMDEIKENIDLEVEDVTEV